MSDYSTTRARVEDYFDRSATKVWERLCSDAPVSRIRQTVRQGRDAMRAMMLAQLPDDLTGLRILDAGCGTGLMTAELARRGATVVAVDISPQLIAIAQRGLEPRFAGQVTFAAGDMTAEALGQFDHVVAMDSLIYYSGTDIAGILQAVGARTRGKVVFTVAPRTPFLMAFFTLGKAFPRADRSPTMVPHAYARLSQSTGPGLAVVGRISRGFYISECLEYRP